MHSFYAKKYHENLDITILSCYHGKAIKIELGVINMKKITKILSVTLMLAFILSGCGTKANSDSQSSSSNDVQNDSQEKKTFILGLDASFPPMGYKDENDTIVGFDIDLAQEVCNRLGYELKLQPIDWDNKEMELNDAKSIDCIWNGLSYSEKRAEDMLLSESYMTNRQVVVVLADSPINTLADLAGKTLALQSGSTASEAVDANADFSASLGEIIKIDDNVKAMMDLEVGGSDAVAMDEVVARYYMSKNDGKFRVLEESLSDELYVIGFRKTDQTLCDDVINCLKEMKEDGKLAEISKKWFGSDITTLQ